MLAGMSKGVMEKSGLALVRACRSRTLTALSGEIFPNVPG